MRFEHYEMLEEEFENTKGVIRIGKLKEDRHLQVVTDGQGT